MTTVATSKPDASSMPSATSKPKTADIPVTRLVDVGTPPVASSSLNRRVALVIGNAAYNVGPLQSPGYDARAIAEALEKIGFDSVTLRLDLGTESFQAALREFSRDVARADLALVYFAGHGTEHMGKSFLVPIDAKLQTAGATSVEAIALDTVIAHMDGARRLKLVIVDACRDNPFPLAGRSWGFGSRGLSRVNPAENALVVYAAEEGTVAVDVGAGKHSPFTEALLKHIATPGLEISSLFRRVRDDVLAATSRVQQPHVYGSLPAQRIFLQSPGKFPSSAAAENIKGAELALRKAELEMLKAEAGAKSTSPAAPKLAEDVAKLEATIALKELVRRGDKLLSRGDVVAARALYERAAAMGSAEAALAMGTTYDPRRLWSLGVFGVVGSKESALHWYQRADELGHPEAKARIGALQ